MFFATEKRDFSVLEAGCIYNLQLLKLIEVPGHKENGAGFCLGFFPIYSLYLLRWLCLYTLSMEQVTREWVGFPPCPTILLK